MATYTTSAIVSAMIGITISATSSPTTTQMTAFLAEADKKINGEMKQTTNITDNYGSLSPIAAALCYKMVINLWAIKEPDKYDRVEVKLSKDDIRTIHMTYSYWQTLSWKMGE